jgi:LysM repeat protein
MHKIQMRGLIVVGGLLLMLLAAGCFQSAGDTLPVTSVAQGVATFTPFPSETPIPDEPEETPSETPLPEALPSPTEDLFASPTPENAGSVVGQDNGDSQAQVIEDADLTATVIIGRVTAEAALALTMTADALATEVIPTLPPPIVTATESFDQGGGGVVVQPPQQNFVQGNDCIHVVQASDRNLWRISLRYGVTVHDIAAASGIANIQLIYIGQQLTIPGCGGIPPQYPPDGPVSCNPNGPVHIVRQNENLFRISLQYGVSVASLVACNGIPNKNLIYIDQQIVIP